MLLDQLICRTFKANHCFKLLTKNYSYYKTHEIFDQRCYLEGNFTLYVLTSYNTNFQQLFRSNKGMMLNVTFNLMLWQILYDNIEKFFSINHLQEKINIALAFTDVPHQAKTLNSYKKYMIINYRNPLDFFTRAFRWKDTQEGYLFWNEIDHQYKIYLFNILKK